jgi:hypothetical protein
MQQHGVVRVGDVLDEEVKQRLQRYFVATGERSAQAVTLNQLVQQGNYNHWVTGLSKTSKNCW